MWLASYLWLELPWLYYYYGYTYYGDAASAAPRHHVTYVSPRRCSSCSRSRYLVITPQVQQLLDITRVHAALDDSSLDHHAFDIASLSSSSSFSLSDTTSPSPPPPSASSFLDDQAALSLLKREIA